MSALETLTLPQTTLVDLRRQLSTHLVAADRVQAPTGVATGWNEFDQFLLWRGLPKGALSVFQGAPGLGPTTLWTQAAAQVTKSGRWCAWLSHAGARLNPWTLRRRGVNLQQLIVVSGPKDAQQRLWALQELLALGLFDLVGCDLGKENFSDRQLVQLRQLTARAQSAVVLLSARPVYGLSRFALAADFTSRGVRILRALHRQTPHLLGSVDVFFESWRQIHLDVVVAPRGF